MLKFISTSFLLGFFFFQGAANAQQTFYQVNTIQKIEVFFGQSNWRAILDSLKATSDGYLTADSVRINGSNFPLSNVKFKGNSSYDSSFAKNPFTIKLDKNITQDYQGISSIKLSNIYQDPSCIREVLAYNLLGNYMECSRANFAQVYVNNVLQGLYTNVEDITKTFAAYHFKSTKTNTFFKCNPIITPGPAIKSNLMFISNESSDYTNFYELESDNGWNELPILCNTISNTPSLLSSTIDIDRALWMLAYDNVTVNLDSYVGAFAQNYFMFKDNNGIFNPIIWDMNMAFGAFPFLGSSNTSLGTLSITQQKQLSIFAHENDSYWPLIKGLLANPSYKKMYVAHVKTLTEEMFASGYYKTLATTFQSIIDTAVLSDMNNFYAYTDFKNGLSTDIPIGNYSAPGIANLMDARVSYLQGTVDFTYATPAISQINPSFDGKDSMVSIQVKVTNADSVYLGSRLNLLKKFNRISMFDDGLHNDGAANDSIYGISIKMVPGESQYYIYAENATSGKFSPDRSEHEYYSISLTAGVGEVIAKPNYSFSIYPNPASTVFSIETTDFVKRNFQVFNLLGEEVINGEFTHKQEFNTNNWKNGIYLMRVENTIQKFIIQH